MEEPRRLGNRYELGAVLGRGGMAEVFMARDIRLGRAVAVKTLRADMARDATFQARFRREAQSAASLNHPAIVAVYDTGEDYIGGLSLPYIVMEYVDGSTLRDLLHSGRRLLPERALEITSGVLQALDYSHRNGIIHRDIKPANVMLTRQGAVKVMDFGIARAMGDQGMTMTQTSAVIGTAQYLSPEQAKGETVDARSDLYSAGCLLYELLTGRPPFVGDSPVAVAYQHVREAPVPPSHHDPEVPPVADAITLKALGKHPDERYQSAEEMRADIERALDGRPIAAAPTLVAGYGAASAPTQVVSNAGYGQSTAGYGPPTRYQPAQYQPSGAGYADDEVDPGPRRRSDSGGGRGGKKKNDKTGYIILAVIAVIAIIMAVVLANLLGGGGGGAPASSVPDITGLSVNDANAKLAAVGLKLGSSTCGSGSANTQFPNGQILSQNPAKGAAATSGEPINYCVSTGAQQYTMPSQQDLNSRTVDAVKQTLTGYGFTNITEQSTTSQSVTSGNVIDVQDSNGNSLAGKNVAVTTPIVLVYSSGKQSGTVPPVVGHTLDDAKNAITQAGFSVGNISYQSSDNVPSGDVISESPTGQQQQGTPINLVVSQGPNNQGSPTPSSSATCTFFGLNCPTPSTSASKGGNN